MSVLSVRQLLKIHESSYDRPGTAIQINVEYLSKSLMQMQAKDEAFADKMAQIQDKTRSDMVSQIKCYKLNRHKPPTANAFPCVDTLHICVLLGKVNIEKSIEIPNLRKTSVCKPLRQIVDSNRSWVGICKQRANFLPISPLSSCQPKPNTAKQSRSFFVDYF